MAHAPAANHPMEVPAKSRKVMRLESKFLRPKKKHPCDTLVVRDPKRNIKREKEKKNLDTLCFKPFKNWWTSLIPPKDSRNWQLIC
jgi:hypothetical protein